MTFHPELMSFRLLTVIIFSQSALRVISGQEAACQSVAGVGPSQFSCLE